jgi:hypothetical protein
MSMAGRLAEGPDRGVFDGMVWRDSAPDRFVAVVNGRGGQRHDRFADSSVYPLVSHARNNESPYEKPEKTMV